MHSNQQSFEAIASRIRAATPLSLRPVSEKHAAVLVPLFQDAAGTVRVVLTKRAASLSTHAGEVALPGGKRDATDANDVATALREAEEELGLTDVQILGTLSPVLSKHLLSVTPVIGWISADCATRPNPGEVEAVFDVPLASFLEDEEGMHSYFDTHYERGEVIQYRLHSFRHGEHDVWGLTAGILIEVAAIALGRAPAFAVMPGDVLYSDIFFDGQRIRSRQ